MGRKVKKTRIYQEPNFTGNTGYVLADGGENQPTGKITFENLGKLLGSNPLIVIFMPDGQGSYTMYRQTTFEINVQPQMEPIDFAWLYENSYKVMVCAAVIYGTPEHGGTPIFFFSGLYSEPQTYQPYFEFTRFDTTEDAVVTEHSILVTTDAQTGENTIITERYVDIDQHDIDYIVESIDTSSGGPARIYAQCNTWYAKTDDYKRKHPLILVRPDIGNGDIEGARYRFWGYSNSTYYFQQIILTGVGTATSGWYPKPEATVLCCRPNDVWVHSVTCATETWATETFVAKETGKGLSANDYTNADKATVTLASAAIPSDASASDQLVKESDLDAALNNAVAIVGEGAISVNEVSGSSNILKVGINEDAAPTVRSVLEAYPDPNDSSVMRYRWVSIGTVVV